MDLDVAANKVKLLKLETGKMLVFLERGSDGKMKDVFMRKSKKNRTGCCVISARRVFFSHRHY